MKTIALMEDLRTFLIFFQNKNVGGNMNINIDTIILTLIGAIVWKSTWEIVVYSENVGQNNMWLSFHTRNGRYFLSYNVRTHQFDLTKDSRMGKVIYSFDNNCSDARVQRIFAAL